MEGQGLMHTLSLKARCAPKKANPHLHCLLGHEVSDHGPEPPWQGPGRSCTGAGLLQQQAEYFKTSSWATAQT